MEEILQDCAKIVLHDENGKFIKGHPKVGGREKGTRSFTTKVREALEKIAEGKDYTYEAAFIKAILKKGIVDQDTGMMKTIWEQLDGKPIQRVANADGSNITPILVEFLDAEPKNNTYTGGIQKAI